MEIVLKLLKIALSINHNLRDEYFTQMLTSRNAELAEKGIVLDLAKVEDQILLCDYSEWLYRKRTEDIPLAQNLQWRLRNRKTKARAADAT